MVPTSKPVPLGGIVPTSLETRLAELERKGIIGQTVTSRTLPPPIPLCRNTAQRFLQLDRGKVNRSRTGVISERISGFR